MDAFDRIFGYDAIKKELRRTADALNCPVVYELIGVTAPKGLLLHGEPGVGKTMMARALIEASGRTAYTCRRNEPSGDFIRTIRSTFDKAMDNAPSIVFLDDLDKFSMSEMGCENEEEYVAVQACIDNLDDGVFVLATANCLHNLPDSLIRPGRFDKVIYVDPPSGKGAVEITKHYLAQKSVAEDVDAELITRIIEGHSCAMLETAVNAAGLLAGYERLGSISMHHLILGCIETVFQVPTDLIVPNRKADPHDPSESMTRVACHEAGHTLVAEVLEPGSVTLTCIHDICNYSYGFTACAKPENTCIESAWISIMKALAGGAAVEQRFGIRDDGCVQDYENARRAMYALIAKDVIRGFSLMESPIEDSDVLRARQEQAIASELDQLYETVKRIVANNEGFLEDLTCALLNKGLLTAPEIQSIKKKYRFCSVEKDETYLPHQTLRSAETSCRMVVG